MIALLTDRIVEQVNRDPKHQDWLLDLDIWEGRLELWVEVGDLHLTMYGADMVGSFLKHLEEKLNSQFK